MKLLENDITNIIINTYDISCGYISTASTESEKLNGGIVNTFPLSANNIKHVSKIQTWKKGIYAIEDTMYVVGNSVFVCLYSPTNIKSNFSPNGKLHSNILLDDNYVWRYICDVDYVVDDNYVVLSNPKEYIRKGCISSLKILEQSNHIITDFKKFYVTNTSLSNNGSDLSYVVENDQNTNNISDVLVQNGGEGYSNSDIFVLTDVAQNDSDKVKIDLKIVDGKVSVESYTNGQNYSHIDILIIGDGKGADVNFSMVAGVMTNLTIANQGSGYTWAKAVVLNSEKYVICSVKVEPLNGYNSDIYSDKYLVQYTTNKISKQINFYGIHKKLNNTNKYVKFEDVFFIDGFTPSKDESVTLQLILG